MFAVYSTGRKSYYGQSCEWSKWLIRASTTLAISCCALVIYLFLWAFLEWILELSLSKVLTILENLSKAKYVVCEQPEVTDVITANRFTKEDPCMCTCKWAKIIRFPILIRNLAL